MRRGTRAPATASTGTAATAGDADISTGIVDPALTAGPNSAAISSLVEDERSLDDVDAADNQEASQHDQSEEIDGGGGAPPNKKRKTAGAAHSGRAVANLTPEQLSKKREHDKLAQRNIRERTRTRIDELERLVEQLRSDNGGDGQHEELERVRRERDGLAEENREMKRRIEWMFRIMRPFLDLGASGDANGESDGDERVRDSSSSSMGLIELSGALGPSRNAALDSASAPTAQSLAFPRSANGAQGLAAPTPGGSELPSTPGWRMVGTVSAAQGAIGNVPRALAPDTQQSIVGLSSSIYRLTDSEQQALHSMLDGVSKQKDCGGYEQRENFAHTSRTFQPFGKPGE